MCEDEEFNSMSCNSKLTKVVEKIKVKNKSIKEMTKDEVLEYTAKHNIEADYSMTKAKLKQIIKHHKGDI